MYTNSQCQPMVVKVGAPILQLEVPGVIYLWKYQLRRDNCSLCMWEGQEALLRRAIMGAVWHMMQTEEVEVEPVMSAPLLGTCTAGSLLREVEVVEVFMGLTFAWMEGQAEDTLEVQECVAKRALKALEAGGAPCTAVELLGISSPLTSMALQALMVTAVTQEMEHPEGEGEGGIMEEEEELGQVVVGAQAMLWELFVPMSEA